MPRQAIRKTSPGSAQATPSANSGIRRSDDRLAELQAMADRSPKVAGLAALQKLAVLQAKDLAPDKLNIAGETHGDSAKQRDREAAYAKARTGGTYQTEGQFATKKWALFGDEKKGDPFMLRAEFRLAILLEDWAAGLLTKLSGKSEFVQTQAWNGGVRDRLSFEITQAESFLNYAAADNAEKAEAAKASGAKAKITLLRTSLDTVDPTKLDTEVIGKIREICALYAAQVLGTGAIRSKAAVRVLRSDAMRQAGLDNAARTIGKQKGVWKVGNDHITDIAGMAATSDFELLTTTEFIQGFDVWEKE